MRRKSGKQRIGARHAEEDKMRLRFGQLKGESAGLRCTTFFAWQLRESALTSSIDHDGDEHEHDRNGRLLDGADLAAPTYIRRLLDFA